MNKEKSDPLVNLESVVKEEKVPRLFPYQASSFLSTSSGRARGFYFSFRVSPGFARKVLIMIA
jgi:hypothetical protein